MKRFYNKNGQLDKKGFLNYLIQEHHPNLFAYAQKVCLSNGFGQHEVEDFLQITYLNIWEKSDSLHQTYIKRQGKIMSYLCTVLRNCVRMERRKKKRRLELKELYFQQVTTTVDFQMLNLEEEFDEFVELLKTNLPKREATIMHYYIKGYGYPEISQILDIKKGTVGAIIHRCKKKIAQLLEKEERLRM